MTSLHSGMRMHLYEVDAKTPESEAESYVQMAAAAIRSAIAASARLPVASVKDGLLYEALASLERWEGARCRSPSATVAEGSSSRRTARPCGAGATLARARAPASTRGTTPRGTGATGSWTPPSRSTATWTRTRAGVRPSTTCG